MAPAQATSHAQNNQREIGSPDRAGHASIWRIQIDQQLVEHGAYSIDEAYVVSGDGVARADIYDPAATPCEAHEHDSLRPCPVLAGEKSAQYCDGLKA
jgi:hypothetical protein